MKKAKITALIIISTLYITTGFSQIVLDDSDGVIVAQYGVDMNQH